MTVLGALARRNLENPAVPLTDASLLTWMTGARALAGVAVTEQRVLGLPAYYRAVALTAGTLAGLPFKVYRIGTRERVRQRTVLDSPNARQTPFEFWFTIYANSIGWGNGYGRKLRDGSDIVREVWPIHPRRVRVEEIDTSEANPEGKLFLVNDRHGVEQRYTAFDIFHLPYLSPDGITGVRPLELFRQSLGIAIAADDTSANFYGNGTRVSGILQASMKLKDGVAEKLKQRWQERNAGPENAGNIAVLDNGVEFKALSIPPGDAQLLESRQWAVTEIARMVGTPPHLIGDVEKSTSWGTGIEQQVLGWVKFTLNSWITLSAQRSTRELLPGGWKSGSWFAEHSLEGLLRGDSKARAEFYRLLVSLGAMSPAQVRDLENWEPVDGLDFFTVPANMTIIEPGGEIRAIGSATAGADSDAASLQAQLDELKAAVDALAS